MLTPPNCCIQMTVSINRATRCFETVIADIHSAGSGFRCVLLADSKHQRKKRAIPIPRQSALKKMGLGSMDKGLPLNNGFVSFRYLQVTLTRFFLPRSPPRSVV
jgi:hypothetical protein